MLYVVRRLRRAGYQALLAGGCVRDLLLGRRPHDYDIATDARPESVCALFARSRTVGAHFGVVIVLVGNRQVEVATFRSDTDYTDGRRPVRVVFTDARHDAQRRDFTINGMFLNPLTGEVIDYVGGQTDLQRRLIRAIGDPDARFAEDHLRMLRAIRFAARFDFTIDPATWRDVVKHADKLARISPERITLELEYILSDPSRARGLDLALESGLSRVIFPGLSNETLRAGIAVLERLPARCSFALALAGLLCHTDARTVERLCRRLKTSNELRQQTAWLVEHHEKLLAGLPLQKSSLKKWLAQPLFEPLVRLLRCKLRAAGRSTGPLRILRRQIRALGNEPIAPPPLLNGHDLMRLGCPAGPQLGRLIEELYLAQLENEVTTRAQAREWARHWLQSHKETG